MAVGGIGMGGFVLQMFEDMRNHCRVFNTGDDFHLTATVLADFHVDVENTFATLTPSHRSVSLCGTLAGPIGIGLFGFSDFPAALSGCHLNTVFTVRREYPMKPGQVDPWFGY